jgi:hypothetical protein
MLQAVIVRKERAAAVHASSALAAGLQASQHTLYITCCASDKAHQGALQHAAPRTLSACRIPGTSVATCSATPAGSTATSSCSTPNTPTFVLTDFSLSCLLAALTTTEMSADSSASGLREKGGAA